MINESEISKLLERNVEDVHLVFQYPSEMLNFYDNYSLSYLVFFFELTGFFSKFRKLHIKIIKNINKKAKAQKKYLFIGDRRFFDLIRGIGKETCLLTMTKKWYSFFLESLYKKIFLGANTYHLFDIAIELSELFVQDPLLKSDRAKRLVAKTVELIQDISPEFLILHNDSQFLERFFIYCARKVGIKSICYQHGIFSSKMNKKVYDGHFADYIFVWGESIKKMYIDKGFNQKKVVVCCYHSNIPKKKKKNTRKKNICFLSEGYDFSDKLKYEHTLKICNDIISYLGHGRYNYFYKPHPTSLAQHWPKYVNNMKVLKSDIKRVISCNDIFIGFTTTALFEANLHGKIAIQIFDDLFESDNFQEMGYCYTLKRGNLNKIQEYIESIDSNYISDSIVRTNKVGEKIVELLDSINLNGRDDA